MIQPKRTRHYSTRYFRKVLCFLSGLKGQHGRAQKQTDGQKITAGVDRGDKKRTEIDETGLVIMLELK